MPSSKMRTLEFKYSKAELLSLKYKAHTTRISTEVCNHIKNLRIK